MVCNQLASFSMSLSKVKCLIHFKYLLSVFFFLYFRFTWPPLHSSRDLHVHGEASPVFLSWCNAGKVTLCYTLSWGPSEWLKESKTQIHTCTKIPHLHVHLHPEIFRKTYFAGKGESLSAPIYFSLIVETSTHLAFQEDQCFVLLFALSWITFLDGLYRNLHVVYDCSNSSLDNMELHFYFPPYPMVSCC